MIGVVVEGSTVPWKGERRVVLPKCDNNDMPGTWFCANHELAFPNNISKDGHAGDPGVHILAWFCHEHGPEVP